MSQLAHLPIVGCHKNNGVRAIDCQSCRRVHVAGYSWMGQSSTRLCGAQIDRLAPSTAWSRQWRLDLLQHPAIARSVQMAIVSVKAAMKNVLEQAGALAAHDWIVV